MGSANQRRQAGFRNNVPALLSAPVELWTYNLHKRRINKRLLKEAYRKLYATQRHAVYLYYIKELTWEEVAEILGITVHSSMNLIGRAIVKLRRLFENK